MTVIEANSTNFKTILKNHNRIIIDFYADWCAPCKTFLPIFFSTAKKFHNKISFLKVDISICPEIAQEYNIKGIPTILLLEEQEIKAVNNGAFQSSKNFEDWFLEYFV